MKGGETGEDRCLPLLSCTTVASVASLVQCVYQVKTDDVEKVAFSSTSCDRIRIRRKRQPSKERERAPRRHTPHCTAACRQVTAGSARTETTAPRFAEIVGQEAERLVDCCCCGGLYHPRCFWLFLVVLGGCSRPLLLCM
jgi:hypothetical protein